MVTPTFIIEPEFVSQYGKGKISYVYTPKGSKVEVLIYTKDLSQSYYRQFENEANTYVTKNTIKVYAQSIKFNCHSFAWYDQNYAFNNKWMNFPNKYWEDKSYSQKASSKVTSIPSSIYVTPKYSTQQIQAGGIVSSQFDLSKNPKAVYFLSNGDIDHSAIVWDSRNNLVISKWGPLGLYIHKLNESPYIESTTVKYYS